MIYHSSYMDWVIFIIMVMVAILHVLEKIYSCSDKNKHQKRVNTYKTRRLSGLL